MTPSLPPHEAAVARLVAQNVPYETIALRLGVSYHTVCARVKSAAKRWPKTDPRKPREKLVAWAGGREG